MEHCGPFPSDELNFTSESFNGNPFETSFKKGFLTSLKVNRNLRDADSNLVNYVAEQLQLSLQGEDCEKPKSCRSSPEIKPNAVYQATENTLGGKCATQYGVSLLPESNLQSKSNENGPFFVVVKITDYKKCQEPFKDPEANELDLFTHSKRIIVSGNKEEHTIQAVNSTIQRAEFLGRTHISTPILRIVQNMTLISTDPTDGHPQNISNPEVFDSLGFIYG